MPSISQKAQMMPPSPIRKLVPFADEAKRKGRKVYHLNIGQPDIPTTPLALDAIHRFNEKVIEYSHSAGTLSYRKKLTEYYAKHNIIKITRATDHNNYQGIRANFSECR